LSEKKQSVENLIEKKFRNIKLETKIIAYTIRRNWKIVDCLRSDYFTIDPYKFFLEYMKESKAEMPKDIFYSSIKTKIKNDLELYKIYIKKVYNADLENVTSKNINKLCEKLKQLYESRRLFNLIDDTLDSADTFSLEETKKNFSNYLISCQSNVESDSGEYLEDFESRKEHQKKLKENKFEFFANTGIKEFDKLSGGIQIGEFVVLIMQTGGGKSISLMNIGVHNYFKEKNVVYVTFEMGKMACQFRMDSRITRIEHSKFRKGDLNVFDLERWENKINSMRERKNNYFEIVPLPRGGSIKDIESACSRIQDKRKSKIDVLLIDYLNLMTVEGSKDSQRDWKYQTEVAWNIKAMTMDWNDKRGLVTFTANQLTDDGLKSKRLEAHHVKYGRAIAEVCPVILGITPSENEELENIWKLWVIKCRDFEKLKKPIVLHPRLNYMMMHDPKLI
jgi:replicative DNA helicase